MSKADLVLDENLTQAEIDERHEWGRNFIRTLDEGLKIAAGEMPRSKKPFAEWIDNWILVADEMRAEGGGDEKD